MYLQKTVMKTPLISPSLLSADFTDLRKDVEMLNASDADMIHCDVMDGVFVPNISFGFPVIKAVKAISQKPLDVHLMIVHPERYIGVSRDSGAEWLSVHQEAVTHLDRVIHQIQQAGMKASVALNPATSVFTLEDVIADLDMVLLMSVNPGFGGQKFIENTIKKVHRLRKLIADSGSHAVIEVDGGVNGDTAPRLIDAGVDVLVSGSYVFKASNPLETIASLKTGGQVV